MDDAATQKIREHFATTLRRKRNEAGLSQEELGFRSGLAMRFISMLETNNRQPTISTIAALCDGLGVSMSAFMAEVEALGWICPLQDIIAER